MYSSNVIDIFKLSSVKCCHPNLDFVCPYIFVPSPMHESKTPPIHLLPPPPVFCFCFPVFLHVLTGIFAFKCSRAEEIFNLLQELMQCNSINVVEEPMIMTRPGHAPEMDMPRTPQTPNSELEYLLT